MKCSLSTPVVSDNHLCWRHQIAFSTMYDVKVELIRWESDSYSIIGSWWGTWDKLSAVDVESKEGRRVGILASQWWGLWWHLINPPDTLSIPTLGHILHIRSVHLVFRHRMTFSTFCKVKVEVVGWDSDGYGSMGGWGGIWYKVSE